ncbi:hypothetical protein [Janthinobacterium aquaticum]|uniref:hypothetical protein n=1 Tax=Janthinobacterium sp. FT58W TaxID=2654254 RepID=UPI0012659BD3|nr:hypothetical protein [Janthinobacterium sp. FT58W]KAB8041485.1 hypothetical protein GCM43_18915 [Janthinobacterium sp. FT58W]
MTFNSMRESLYSLSRSNAGVTSAVLFSMIAAIGLWNIFPDIDNENHLLECLQALFLALACGVHATRAWQESDRQTLSFLMHAGLAVLLFAFLLRELDIDSFGAEPFWTYLEKVLRVIGLLMLLRTLIFIAPRAGKVLSHAAMIFGMRVTILTAIGGLLMVAGWPFDKKVIHGLSEAHSLLGEEVCELGAYLLLFLASLSDTTAARLVSLAPRKKA